MKKGITIKQLEHQTKEHKRKMQLAHKTKLVDDLLDRSEHLLNLSIRVDFKPSYKDIQKIQKIKNYIDAVLKMIDIDIALSLSNDN